MAQNIGINSHFRQVIAGEIRLGGDIPFMGYP